MTLRNIGSGIAKHIDVNLKQVQGPAVITWPPVPIYRNGIDLLISGESLTFSIGDVENTRYFVLDQQFGAMALPMAADASELIKPIKLAVTVTWTDQGEKARQEREYSLIVDTALFRRSEFGYAWQYPS